MEKDEIVIAEILVAAKLLFGKYGLKKTTIEDIASAAGKGKSTLYNYFPGKNEIFEAVVNFEMETMVRNLNETLRPELTTKQKLRLFLTVQSAAITELKSLRKVLFEDIVEARRLLIPLKLKFEKIQISMIADILIAGQKSEELKTLSAERIHKMSVLLLFAFKGIQYPLSINPTEIKPTEYFDELIDTLFEGIGN